MPKNCCAKDSKTLDTCQGEKMGCLGCAYYQDKDKINKYLEKPIKERK